MVIGFVVNMRAFAQMSTEAKPLKVFYYLQTNQWRVLHGKVRFSE